MNIIVITTLVIAIMNAIGIKTRKKKLVDGGCDGCCAACSKACDQKEEVETK